MTRSFVYTQLIVSFLLCTLFDLVLDSVSVHNTILNVIISFATVGFWALVHSKNSDD